MTIVNKKEISYFFECLGEIWRDITAIEFLMRCAITQKDEETNKFPKPPYNKNKVYLEYPKSFSHFSFEKIVEKFNKRFPLIQIPKEIVELRDAMAHGVIAQINNDSTEQLIKFKETENKELKIEFSLTLEPNRIAQLRQSLKELRGYIMKEANDKNEI